MKHLLRLPALLGFALCLPALAHEGHGLEGASHYHATDVWGFVAFACAAAIAW